MKNITMLLLFAGLMGSISMAQDDKPKDDLRVKKEKRDKLSPEEKADKRTDKMNEVLNLSDKQAADIKAINLQHIQEMESIKEEIKALKKKAHEKRDANKLSIEAVLDADQNEKLKAEHEKHKLEREKKRRERCCQKE